MVDPLQLGSMVGLAQMYAAYYNALCEHGMPPYMAIELVRDFQRLMYTQIAQHPESLRRATLETRTPLETEPTA